MDKMTNEEAEALFEEDMSAIERITESKLNDPDPSIRMRARAMKGYGHACQRWVGSVIAELDKETDPTKRDQVGRLMVLTITQVWALIMTAVAETGGNNPEEVIQFAKEVVEEANHELAIQLAKSMMEGAQPKREQNFL